MRWQGKEGSRNVEDARHRSGGKKTVFAGGGLVTIGLALAIWFLGGNPLNFLQQQGGVQIGGGQAGGEVVEDPERDKFEAPLAKFSSVVLKYTEDVWSPIFERELGKTYRPPTLKLYREGTDSGCGYGSEAAGPFYCPNDRKIYLDLTFFAKLQQQFKAEGDFTMAYVIAHEVAHHVQNELGWSAQIQQLQRQASEIEANRLSVRLELQADYLAGVWVRNAERQMEILERGDLEEALNAAKRIGDDTLQREATGTIRPDGFTHGSSEQRVRWLRKGIESGELSGATALFDLDYQDL